MQSVRRSVAAMTEATRTYPHGVPCWVQLEEPDTSEASRFYGDLFGWTFENAGPGDAGSFLFARLHGGDVGALARTPGAHRWTSFIACDDIEATCAAVRDAGGTVDVPPDAGTPFGRGAVCTDPQGAGFHLWQAASHPGSQVVNEPGAWNFSDLHTPDPEASIAFYGAVFGWRLDADLGAGMIRQPGYGDHLESTVDPDIRDRQAFAPEGFEDVIAGITADSSPASWQIRFTVADRDASAAEAEKLGATIESRADTEWTKEAVIVDPQGARFVVSQLDAPD